MREKTEQLYVLLMMTYYACRSINRNDLLEYIGTHYKGPRMVLAAAGGKNWRHVVLSR